LCRDRDLALLPRRERPNQRDNPPDKGPTGKQIQGQDSGEVRPFARQKSGQKIEKQRNDHENRVEMEKGYETQRRDQHGTRSARTHDVFYHGLTQFERGSRREGKAHSARANARFNTAGICHRTFKFDRRRDTDSRTRPPRDGRPGVSAGTHWLAAEHASCVFPSDVFYCLRGRDRGLRLLRQPWSSTTAAEITRKSRGRASSPATSLAPITRPLACSTFGWRS